MSRVILDHLTGSLETAYRRDPFHSVRGNLGSVLPDEWDVRPAEHSVEVFGTQPELSIADIVLHVGAGKRMYANHAFGDAALRWEAVPLPPASDPETMLTWLDESHQIFADGLATLTGDSDLAVERPIHTGRRIRTDWIISLVINHDLYHAGEINRQRALIRGATGWTRALTGSRPAPAAPR